jgi:WD40 repeat protein
MADGTVRVHAVGSGELLATLRGHGASISSVHFAGRDSRGGRGGRSSGRLCSGSADGKVVLWQSETGVRLADAADHTRKVSAISSDLGGELVVTASWDSRLQLYRGSNLAHTGTLQGPHRPANAVTVRADGLWAAAGYWDGTIQLFDLVAMAAVAVLAGHGGSSVRALAYSPNGARLVSAAADGALVLWSAAKRSALGTYHGHAAAVSALCFDGGSGSGGGFVTASEDGTVKTWADQLGTQLWRTAAATPATTLTGHSSAGTHSESEEEEAEEEEEEDRFAPVAAAKCVRQSPDGLRLAVGRSNGTVVVQTARSGQQEHLVHSPDRHAVTAVGWTGDAELLVGLYTGAICKVHVGGGYGYGDASGGANLARRNQRQQKTSGEPAALHVRDGHMHVLFAAHTGPVLDIDTAADPAGSGMLGASGSSDCTARVWHGSTQKDVELRLHTAAVTAVRFVPGRAKPTLATGSRDGMLVLWGSGDSWRHWTPLQTVAHAHSDWINAIAVAGSGTVLVTASNDCNAKVWNIAQPARPTAPSAGAPASTAASAADGDGSRTASFLTAGPTLRGHNGAVTSVAMVTDRVAVTGSFDGTTRAWVVASAAEITALTSTESGASNCGRGDPVLAVCSTGGERVYAAGQSGAVTAFSPFIGQPTATLAGHRGQVASVGCGGAGQIVSCGRDDKTIRHWQTEAAAAPVGDSASAGSAAAGGSSNGAAVAGSTGSDASFAVTAVALTRVRRGNQLVTLAGNSAGAISVSVRAGDGEGASYTRTFAAAHGGAVSKICVFDRGADAWGADHGSSGVTFATVSLDATVAVWRWRCLPRTSTARATTAAVAAGGGGGGEHLPTFEPGPVELARYRCKAPLTAAAICGPCGSVLAVGGWAGRVAFFQITRSTGQPQLVLQRFGPEGGASSLRGRLALSTNMARFACTDMHGGTAAAFEGETAPEWITDLTTSDDVTVIVAQLDGTVHTVFVPSTDGAAQPHAGRRHAHTAIGSRRRTDEHTKSGSDDMIGVAVDGSPLRPDGGGRWLMCTAEVGVSGGSGGIASDGGGVMRVLAVGNGALEIRDATTTTQGAAAPRCHQAHTASVVALAAVGNGSRELISCARDGLVKRWRVGVDGMLVQLGKFVCESGCTAMARLDGHTAVGDAFGKLYLLSV